MMGRMDVTWLAEPTVEALRAALRRVAPGLAEGSIVPRGLGPQDDPQWCAASAVVDGRYVVKFAWSRPAALRISYQATVLDALRAAAPRLPLPETVTVAHDPAILVLRWVPAVPFFRLRHRIGPGDREPAAEDLAGVLAELHDPSVLPAVARAIGPLPEPAAPATTDALRDGFGPLVRPDQIDRVRAWCDRADTVLATPGRTVLVHGDLHGDNHLWDPDSLRLRLVIDVETVGAAEPEFDMRVLPSDCGIDLFLATVATYERLTGTTVDVDRVMAWHVRTVLGDVRWRAEAGVPLPDGRTPPEWVDDLTARFVALGSSWTA